MLSLKLRYLHISVGEVSACEAKINCLNRSVLQSRGALQLLLLLLIWCVRGSYGHWLELLRRMEHWAGGGGKRVDYSLLLRLDWLSFWGSGCVLLHRRCCWWCHFIRRLHHVVIFLVLRMTWREQVNARGLRGSSIVASHWSQNRALSLVLILLGAALCLAPAIWFYFH